MSARDWGGLEGSGRLYYALPMVSVAGGERGRGEMRAADEEERRNELRDAVEERGEKKRRFVEEEVGERGKREEELWRTRDLRRRKDECGE